MVCCDQDAHFIEQFLSVPGFAIKWLKISNVDNQQEGAQDHNLYLAILIVFKIDSRDTKQKSSENKQCVVK